MLYFPGENPVAVLRQKFGISDVEARKMFDFYGCSKVLGWAHMILKDATRPVALTDRAVRLRAAITASQKKPHESRKFKDSSDLLAYWASDDFIIAERSYRRSVAADIGRVSVAINKWNRRGRLVEEIPMVMALVCKLRLGHILRTDEIPEIQATDVRSVEELLLARVKRFWAGKYAHISWDVECILVPEIETHILPCLFGPVSRLVASSLRSPASKGSSESVRDESISGGQKAQASAFDDCAFIEP